MASRPGAGTRFALHIPSTIFRERVLIADVGGALCALPARAVEAFYERRPFPGYAAGDDAHTLLDRSRASPFLVALDAAIPSGT